jgi:zinc transport system permease protein
MADILAFDFMQNALVAALLASIACGIIGSLVVINRMTFLAGGVAHAAFGGVGLALFLGVPVLPVTIGFSLGSSLLMGWTTLRRREDSDALIGALWAAGMAFGIIMVNLTPGYSNDLMSYLFGSILTVPTADLWLMAGVDGFTLIIALVFYKALVAMSYDEEFARCRNVPTEFLYGLLLVLIAAAVVVLVRMVGLILVIALLTIPPHLAQRHSRSLLTMMAAASLWAIGFCLVGLAVAYRFDLTSGASIIAVATLTFALMRAAGAIRKQIRSARALKIDAE